VARHSGRACPLRRHSLHFLLLRICQEAVTNAVKHAGARSIEIELNFEERRVRLRVKDDGCGFDPRALGAEREAGFGLVSMQERAEHLGGEFSIAASPGRGVEITVIVPINRK
jgi:signal transduction histidine kinase